MILIYIIISIGAAILLRFYIYPYLREKYLVFSIFMYLKKFKKRHPDKADRIDEMISILKDDIKK